MQTWQMAIVMVFMYWIAMEMTSSITVTHTANYEDPLMTYDEKWLSEDAFRSISSFVNGSDIVDYMTGKAADSENGYAIQNWARFNVEGMKKLCYGEELRILCAPLINELRIDGANTFVLRAMVQLPTGYNKSASFFTSSMGVQGVDTDPAVQDRWKQWVPQMVSFLHIQVPDGMIGGHLQVYEDLRPDERELSYLSLDGPAHVSKVATNSLHSVRGDAYWTFTDYDLPEDGRAEHEKRRVSIYLMQYTLNTASYTETHDILIWTVPEGSIKTAIAFGSMLFACGGAGIGVAASQKQQKQGNVLFVAFAALGGFALGGATGAGATLGLNWAYAKGLALVVFMHDWCQDHYIVSPTVTAWFLLTATASIVWSVVVLGAGFVWRTVAGDDAVDEASEGLKAFIEGESVVSMKDSKLRKQQMEKRKKGGGPEEEQKAAKKD